MRGTADFRELDIEAMDELLPRMVAAVSDGVDMLENRVKALLSRPGRSQPGDPPGMGSGELLGSIKSRKPTGKNKRRATGTVYTRKFWAGMHEYGGRDHGLRRFPARPVFRPAVEQVEPAVLRRFDQL